MKYYSRIPKHISDNILLLIPSQRTEIVRNITDIAPSGLSFKLGKISLIMAITT